MILMGAKNAKTYEDLFVLVKQKIQKKWYMIMTMKQSKIKPSDLRKHPMIMKRIKHKSHHVSSCQKLKLILQPGKPAEVTFSIHLDFSDNNH